MPSTYYSKLGERICYCNECEEYFSGTKAFDKHRIGTFGVDRRCADPGSVGLVINKSALGSYWGKVPMTDEEKSKVFAFRMGSDQSVR